MENRSGCTYKATVVDKTGLDGCTLMFQLAGGELLEPVEWSVERPELKAGEVYYINYEAISSISICMTGSTVKITCIMKADKKGNL